MVSVKYLNITLWNTLQNSSDHENEISTVQPEPLRIDQTIQSISKHQVVASTSFDQFIDLELFRQEFFF